ncbi:hypothetical protein AB0B78_20690 [Streptomyces sp. NPDC040724]|uniref:hypothetical protein n=1 Tax=Streptomyces sp. NPDC040724 TaxID=3155612 RepID=UPI0033C846D2
MTSDENPKRPAGQTSWRATTLSIGIGTAALLAGALLMLGPVRSADAAARDFAAAQACAPGPAPSAQAQCRSSVPATVERYWKTGARSTAGHIEVVPHGDGQRQILDLERDFRLRAPASGDEVRLVGWRGEVRYVTYGPGYGRTVFTEANPYTAYAVPFGWGAFLLFFGAILVWIGSWQRWLSHLSRRAAPWQVMVPTVMLALLAAGAPALALAGGVRIEEALSVSGTGVGLAVLVIGAVWLYKALRGESDTVAVEPRRDDREHVFTAHVLGDDTGFGPGPYLVVAPGVLAFSVDPTGAYRRAPLPSGLVLEQVRPVFASDPGAMDLYGRHEPAYLVAQCRDGEREVLIAVARKNMPWLVGALPQADPAAAPDRA